MIEIVCDVEGCEERSPAGGMPLGNVPAGWSVIVTMGGELDEMAARRKLGQFGPAPLMPPMARRMLSATKSVICPKHPLMKFKPRPPVEMYEDLGPLGVI